jgi:LEA14-like dessication related protein
MKASIATTIFLALLVFTSSCAFQPLYIENVEKPDIDNINLSKSDVRFNVVLKNPNSLGFRLVKSDLNVMVNSIEIGKINLASKQKIKPNSSTPIPVSLKLDNSKLLSIGAMSLFSDPKVSLKGYIKGRKFIFPKKYKVDFQDNFSLSDFLGQ